MQFLRDSFRDNFGSAMFLLVVSTIAIAFIGYLLIDYIRVTRMIMRNKRRHRDD